MTVSLMSKTSDPRPTDSEIAARSEEREEICDIIEEYLEAANSIANRMLRNPADAEEAVQEAFLAAYRAFPHFESRSKVTTWLYRIVVNACLMKIRKDKCRANRFTEVSYDEAIIYDRREDPEKWAMNAELKDVLNDGLALLSPDLRAVIVLRDVQGFSSQEVSEFLDVSVSCCKSRVHRARVLLRAILVGYRAAPVD